MYLHDWIYCKILQETSCAIVSDFITQKVKVPGKSSLFLAELTAIHQVMKFFLNSMGRNYLDCFQ